MRKIEHLNELVRIQNIFRVIDFELEYSECAELWRYVSLAESEHPWMVLPESDTDVLRTILKYFDFNHYLFTDFHTPASQYLKTSVSLSPIHIKKSDES